MAEYLKSQTPQELWKARLEPPDPLKPKNPFDPKNLFDPRNLSDPARLQAAKPPGVGELLDITA